MADIQNCNEDAPTFQAEDVFGKKVNLKDYKTGYTLLAFLRYSGCPWCNLAIHRLTLEAKQLKKRDCQIIAFVQSDATEVMHNIYDRHVPKPQFPIIADQVMQYYDMYAVNNSVVESLRMITKIPYWLESVHRLGFKQRKMDGNLFMVPAWFLVNNRMGKIVRSQRGVSFYDHAAFTSIYDAIIFKD